MPQGILQKLSEMLVKPPPQEGPQHPLPDKIPGQETPVFDALTGLLGIQDKGEMGPTANNFGMLLGSVLPLAKGIPKILPAVRSKPLIEDLQKTVQSLGLEPLMTKHTQSFDWGGDPLSHRGRYVDALSKPSVVDAIQNTIHEHVPEDIVPVYRGMSYNEPLTDAKTPLAPKSFSTSPNIAKGFGERIIKATPPNANILGPGGQADELELLVNPEGIQGEIIRGNPRSRLTEMLAKQASPKPTWMKDWDQTWAGMTKELGLPPLEYPPAGQKGSAAAVPSSIYDLIKSSDLSLTARSWLSEFYKAGYNLREMATYAMNSNTLSVPEKSQIVNFLSLHYGVK